MSLRRALAVCSHVTSASASASASAPASQPTDSESADQIFSSVASTSPASGTSSALSGLQLKDSIAVITGSGQGIGRAAAELFAANGAKVCVTDIDITKSDEVARGINAEHGAGTAISVPGDVTDPAFPEKLLSATATQLGNPTILVNNAGFTWDGVIHRMTDEQWAKMLDVHCTAVFRLIRAANQYMREAGKDEITAGKHPRDRCIINISSTSGLHGSVGQINYATGKMGIVGLTKTVAKEWGQFGVRCNAVAFGMIETRLTAAKESGATMEVNGKKVALGIPKAQLEGGRVPCPLQRAGLPMEAAAGIVTLASPISSYITGHTLEVTGGAGI